MRDKLGLAVTRSRIGLAAHDFAQLANAPNVVLTRALRRDGSPTLASRWLWRLQDAGAGRAKRARSAPTRIVAWAARSTSRPSRARRKSRARSRPRGKRLTAHQRHPSRNADPRSIRGLRAPHPGLEYSGSDRRARRPRRTRQRRAPRHRALRRRRRSRAALAICSTKNSAARHRRPNAAPPIARACSSPSTR